jgi:hypothetical protein
MTKKELVEILSQYDDDMLVLIPGYENGFNLTGYVTSTHVMKKPKPMSWDGEFDVSRDSQLTPNGILLHPRERENG